MNRVYLLYVRYDHSDCRTLVEIHSTLEKALEVKKTWDDVVERISEQTIEIEIEEEEVKE